MTTTRIAPASTAATATATASTISARSRLIGRILSGIVVAFLAFDAIIHLSNIAAVRDAFAELGIPSYVSVTSGIVMIVCLAFYVVPATSILGAILLTGYLGGAATVNLINEKPLMSTTMFSIYVGVAVWTALYLRDTRVRALAPWHKA